MKSAATIVLLILVLILAGLNVHQWRTAAFTPDPAIAARFLTVWANQPDTWFKNRFMGIPTWQNPMDVWETLEILWQVKPDVVLEAGTFKGGSALLWAMFLEHIDPDTRVITIDLRPQSHEAKMRPLARERVDFLYGSSTAPEIVEEVRKRVEGKRVLAILDSAHTRDHVYNELKAYADMIEVGSYIIVQDGAVCGHPVDAEPCPGPYEAVEDFLAEDDRFQAIREHERHLISSNTMGYLKRVR
ncbi:MAG: CmcI family methyltransferase [Myxococcota bacterium]